MALVKKMRRVAVVGAGPAGAIAVDALAREETFDVIRVFERREDCGGCWLQDRPDHQQELPDLDAIAARTADRPLTPPSSLPAKVPASNVYRFSDTSIYPHLETNIAASAMQFSQEPFPSDRSEWSIEMHGEDTPFRHWSHVKDYISSLLDRNNYNDLVSYNTTVELIQRNTSGADSWTLTLRKRVSQQEDEWWTESFDAVVVANGHYHVPWIPAIPGLTAYAKAYPGTVIHSKSFRSPAAYAGRRVLVIGASISGPDIAHALAKEGTAEGPITCVVRGKYHPYFFDYAFQHPRIVRKMGLSHFDADTGFVHFADGTVMEKPDDIIFGTGYSWTLPFLENDRSGVDIHTENNRLPGMYQHVFWRDDPTLCFVGAVAAGFTFKVYEWQAVLAARYLAGRVILPPIEEQVKWEQDRIAYKGDGVPFSALYPDFEEYFETVRELAGEPKVVKGEDGSERRVGRSLPKFEKRWREEFDAAHLKRIEMWKRINRAAEEELTADDTANKRTNGGEEARL